jgi:molecular chaperone DnaK
MDQEGKVIGIDLGTTNSVVAFVEGGQPVVIPNTEGSNKTPSVVAFLDGGEVVVGEIARRQAATNPKRTIYSIKRLMGRKYEDIEESGDVFSFGIVDQDDNILIDIDGMGFRPEQISALILKKLKESAQVYLGEDVSQAIITVPAYFDDLQRTSTIEAARMAGLEVLRLINEPTAAALAYGLGKEQEELVAVYDFGGGTFDISVLEIARTTIEVLTSTGDSHLGGDDLDNALVHKIIEEFATQKHVDLTQDPVTLRRLKEVAEKAKCELSSMTHTLLSLPFIAYKDNQPLHLERTFSRKEFETIIDDYVERTISCCRRALDEAGVAKKDVSKVILVGGSTRIPLVQEAVEDFFGIAPFKGVNPDEIVALGAATQGGVFQGNIQEVVLLDVTPHSLGIEVKNGRFSRIIEKNSTIPIKAAKTFTTTEDNQGFVNVHILQGESENAADNRSLGKFTLADIPAAKAGVARIRVTFFINTDGVMEITATELGTGLEKSLTIVHSDLSDEEKVHRRQKRSRRPRGRVSINPRRSVERPVGGVSGGDLGLLEGVGVRKSSEAVLPPPPEVSPMPPATFRMVGETDGGGSRPKSATPSPMPSGGSPSLSATHPEPPAMEKKPAAPAGAPLAAPPTGGAPAIPKEGGLSISPTLLSAPAKALWPMVEARREDTPALEALQRGMKALVELVHNEPHRVADAIVLAHVHILLGQAEEARQRLNSMSAALTSSSIPMLAEAYQALVSRFPTLAQAHRDYGLFLERAGRYDEAIENVEMAHRCDESPDDLVVLERLYRAKGDDSAAQFKLVKILLKDNRLDEAIEILSVLQAHESYMPRALKILGLCYWQKGQRQAAWQKFRILPLNDEIKDIVYRLAIDMETGGELAEANAVLERIVSESPNYRDAASRLKKLQYRSKLQEEELQKAQATSSFQDPRFTLLEEINRGSMGIIFKARDKVLDEIVVLKVLNDYLCADPTAVERFKREARAAKKLSHPHIVRIHDMFQNQQKLFISMEYIEGTDLKRMLSEHTHFSEDKIIQYFLQTCDALAYAHRLGIVHRDIKPANIMITKTDAVKITDFGIAKILRADDATKSGTAIIGTPLYMAPEQITGEGVDIRSDIYSLGITLYEMVSGNPPFYLGNIEYHHIHTSPPPLPNHVSPKLRKVIMKCIEKSPADRFQTVEEILGELKQ